MLPVMLVVGTRPEGIKMMPVYLACKQRGLPVVLCSTGQHDSLLQEVLDLFNIVPDIDLSIMKPGQDISYITSSVLEKLKIVYQQWNPSCVLVQGDTTSVMAATLAAFYQKIPVGHVEAGLRTGDLFNPYPEEANRKIVGLLAQLHFSPTAGAMAHLLSEGIKREFVFCTGNTVVDALNMIQEKIIQGSLKISSEIITLLNLKNKKKVLLTIHRRESFPQGIESILLAIKKYAFLNPDIVFIYPCHPNPCVVAAIEKIGLQNVSNIVLLQPVLYHEMIQLLKNVDLVMTDSGGIQEESVSLGKSVLVLREKSERMEGVWQGLATLVGTNELIIFKTLEHYFKEEKAIENIKSEVYGDGQAAKRIAYIIEKHFYDRAQNISQESSVRIQI